MTRRGPVAVSRGGRRRPRELAPRFEARGRSRPHRPDGHLVGRVPHLHHRGRGRALPVRRPGVRLRLHRRGLLLGGEAEADGAGEVRQVAGGLGPLALPAQGQAADALGRGRPGLRLPARLAPEIVPAAERGSISLYPSCDAARPSPGRGAGRDPRLRRAGDGRGRAARPRRRPGPRRAEGVGGLSGQGAPREGSVRLHEGRRAVAEAKVGRGRRPARRRVGQGRVRPARRRHGLLLHGHRPAEPCREQRARDTV